MRTDACAESNSRAGSTRWVAASADAEASSIAASWRERAAAKASASIATPRNCSTSASASRHCASADDQLRRKTSPCTSTPISQPIASARCRQLMPPTRACSEASAQSSATPICSEGSALEPARSSKRPETSSAPLRACKVSCKPFSSVRQSALAGGGRRLGLTGPAFSMLLAGNESAEDLSDHGAAPTSSAAKQRRMTAVGSMAASRSREKNADAKSPCASSPSTISAAIPLRASRFSKRWRQRSRRDCSASEALKPLFINRFRSASNASKDRSIRAGSGAFHSNSRRVARRWNASPMRGRLVPAEDSARSRLSSAIWNRRMPSRSGEGIAGNCQTRRFWGLGDASSKPHERAAFDETSNGSRVIGGPAGNPPKARSQRRIASSRVKSPASASTALAA